MLAEMRPATRTTTADVLRFHDPLDCYAAFKAPLAAMDQSVRQLTRQSQANSEIVASQAVGSTGLPVHLGGRPSMCARTPSRASSCRIRCR